MGTAVRAHGNEANPDKAIFPAVNLDTYLGANKDLKLTTPIVVAAMGSTNVAADNWDHLAAGCAISGAGIAIGENVCAMDHNVEIKNGRVVHSPNLAKRVKDFQGWSQGTKDIGGEVKLNTLERALQLKGRGNCAAQPRRPESTGSL